MAGVVYGSLKKEMVRLLYNLLLPFGLLALMPGHLRTMRRRGGYGEDFGQRWGRYRESVRAKLDAKHRPLWVHAVSVGEVGIAVKFIDELRRRNPDEAIVLSTTTITGMAAAKQRLPEEVQVIYNPVDLPWVPKRAFDVVKPRQIVLTESEIWPNFIASARKRGIPVSVINARLSPRSAARYRKWSFLARPILRNLSLVCAQEPEDVPVWSALGVSRVETAGSIKFDAGEQKENADLRGRISEVTRGIWGKTPEKILLLGSSHAGEERMLAGVFFRLASEFPDWKLFLVPRHAERRDEVMADMNGLSLKTAVRSRPESDPEARILLVDSTGELPAWYRLASLIVIGKSFLSTGGQNPVEPVLLDRPVICGPHMENFQPLVDRWTEAGAVWRCDDEQQLEERLRELMGDPKRARSVLPKAKEMLSAHRGATSRTADLILSQDD